MGPVGQISCNLVIRLFFFFGGYKISKVMGDFSKPENCGWLFP